MQKNSPDVGALIAKVQQQEKELKLLKAQLDDRQKSHTESDTSHVEDTQYEWPLRPDEYQRYGRQMIIPEVGIQGQIQIRNAAILLVGVGGLGCPAAAYLAGAGVGTLGLMDGDTVELSNLHRQILHTTDRIGELKVESAAASLMRLTAQLRLNPNVNYRLHPEHLTPSTALAIFRQYDVVLDCTDHPTSRYLISDAAVLAGTRLVSASALRTEGQLLVLNEPPRQLQDGFGDGGGGDEAESGGGPCYRCIFPRPPAPESVTSCGEGGILGPVVGVMGVLMAVETLKLLTKRKKTEPVAGGGVGDPAPTFASPAAKANDAKKPPPPAHHPMLIYSAFASTPFRTLKLRGKRADCASCSARPSISSAALDSGSLDYTAFCGVTSSVRLLDAEERTTAAEFAAARRREQAEPFVLLDVRDETQFALCNLARSVNVPFATIERLSADAEDRDVEEALGALRSKLDLLPADAKIYSVCRFGNDSQVAVRKLKQLGLDDGGRRWIGDIQGGFQSWRESVDPNWPQY